MERDEGVELGDVYAVLFYLLDEVAYQGLIDQDLPASGLGCHFQLGNFRFDGLREEPSFVLMVLDPVSLSDCGYAQVELALRLLSVEVESFEPLDRFPGYEVLSNGPRERINDFIGRFASTWSRDCGRDREPQVVLTVDPRTRRNVLRWGASIRLYFEGYRRKRHNPRVIGVV